MFLTIIIPTYNSASCIQGCLESIADQDFRDFEVIVKDGGSVDSTLSIVSAYRDKMNLKIITGIDKGIYDAMNIALTYVNTEYVMFLGSDDVFYSSQSLNAAYNEILSFNNKTALKKYIFYANSYFVKRNIFYDGRFSKFKLAVRNICHQAIIYPASLFFSNRYNLKYPLKADHEFNIKAWSEGYKFVYLDFILTKYNDSGSSNLYYDKKFEEEILKIVKQYLGTLPYLYIKFRKTVKSFFTKNG